MGGGDGEHRRGGDDERAPEDVGVTRLFEEHPRIAVELDVNGRPVAFAWNGRRERVEVCNRWRVEEAWWRRPISRDYYKVAGERILALVYRDGVVPAAGRQLGLFEPQAARAARLEWQLADLAIRFGEGRLLRARLRDPDAPLPEDRVAWAEATASTGVEATTNARRRTSA